MNFPKDFERLATKCHFKPVFDGADGWYLQSYQPDEIGYTERVVSWCKRHKAHVTGIIRVDGVLMYSIRREYAAHL